MLVITELRSLAWRRNAASVRLRRSSQTASGSPRIRITTSAIRKMPRARVSTGLILAIGHLPAGTEFDLTAGFAWQPRTRTHKCGGFEVPFILAARSSKELQIQNRTRVIYLLVSL